MARLRTGPTPLTNYTTAQQLGAFRRELIAEGFRPEQAEELVECAFRCELEFVVRIDGIQGEPMPSPQDNEQSA